MTPWEIVLVEVNLRLPLSISEARSRAPNLAPMRRNRPGKTIFLTADAGPLLEHSTQTNPTIYYTENTNKTAPRYWTIAIETCLSSNGSISYDMLVNKEIGDPQSFNTHENNAAYLMYANGDNYTQLYAQNHTTYGFFADANNDGINDYDAGLPKGLYKVSIRYWDQKGIGLTPTTRTPVGNVLAYQEYWFRLQSSAGIGTGAARVAASEDTKSMPMAKLSPNPVTQTFTLALDGVAGQEVEIGLVDVTGRIQLEKKFTPQSNNHREEVDISHQAIGVYFLRVITPQKQQSLKVIKVNP